MTLHKAWLGPARIFLCLVEKGVSSLRRLWHWTVPKAAGIAFQVAANSPLKNKQTQVRSQLMSGPTTTNYCAKQSEKKGSAQR
jgi:hypothetical protein